MTTSNQKVEIVEVKPTHVKFLLVDEGLKIKTGKQFFNKRVKMGLYEVINEKSTNNLI